MQTSHARRGPPPGASPAPASHAPHSVGHLADEFMMRFVRKNRKRPDDTEANLKRDILRKWRERHARSITPREVIDMLDEIVDRGAPVVANRTARLLDQMYRFGIQRRLVDSVVFTEPVTPPNVAEMVAAPALTALTIPEFETAAIEGEEDRQEAFAVTS